RSALELLYGSALRVGELSRLDVDDVDLNAGVVRVLQGKGGRGRLVPLASGSMPWIAAYLRDERTRWASPNSPSLLISYRGRRLTPNQLRQVLQRLCLMAAISP